MYRPYYSSGILDELSGLLKRKKGWGDARIRYLASQIIKTFPEGYIDDLPAGLEGILTNDPKDRHVLAAAIKASTSSQKIDWIVTTNLKDFKLTDLSAWGISAISPDDFLLELCDCFSTNHVIEILEKQAAGLKSPLSFLELAKKLKKHCPAFISQVLITRYGKQIHEIIAVIIKSGVIGNPRLEYSWSTESYEILNKNSSISVIRKEGGMNIFCAKSGDAIYGCLSVLDVEKFLNEQVRDVVKELKTESIILPAPRKSLPPQS